MGEAVRMLAEAGVTQMIVSDANTIYIDEPLRHWKLRDNICKIVTNPAEWDDKGLLKVRRYVDPDKPHGCVTCEETPNICKGIIMDKEVFTMRKDRRIIYIGDGGGDFCASLRMSKNDILFARTRAKSLDGADARNFTLARRIEDPKYPTPVCEVKLWTDGKELLDLFKKEVFSE